MPKPPFTIGVDTGGTFTDIALIDGDGRLTIDKTFSTPAAPERAVLDVVGAIAKREGPNPASCSRIPRASPTGRPSRPTP